MSVCHVLINVLLTSFGPLWLGGNNRVAGRFGCRGCCGTGVDGYIENMKRCRIIKTTVATILHLSDVKNELHCPK